MGAFPIDTFRGTRLDSGLSITWLWSKWRVPRGLRVRGKAQRKSPETIPPVFESGFRIPVSGGTADCAGDLARSALGDARPLHPPGAGLGLRRRHLDDLWTALRPQDSTAGKWPSRWNAPGAELVPRPRPAPGRGGPWWWRPCSRASR